MVKNIFYDFSCGSLVSVEAEEGMNPSDLAGRAAIMFIQKMRAGQVELVCENIYDPETGEYGEPKE